jgi:hypothetical protein
MKSRILSTAVILAMFALMIMPVTVMADNTMTVSGTIGSSIAVNAPSSIVLGTPMIVGDNTAASTTAGTVTTNGITWHVSVTAANGGLLSNGTNNLTNKLKICPESPYNDTSAVYADVGLTYGSNPTTLPFSASQTVVSGDKNGSYSIILTFTGTVDS